MSSLAVKTTTAWLVALSMMIVGVIACVQEVQTMNEKHTMKTRELVREVLAKHRDTLIETYEAVGVGIGKEQFQDEDYVIVVYLAAVRDVADDVNVDGVRVIFRVTGRIHPQPREGETP